MKTAKQMSFKLLALTLVVGLSVVLPIHINYTMGYYNYFESSSGNVFSAGLLDFTLSQSSHQLLIGPGVVDEETVVTAIMPVEESLDMQYFLSVTSSSFVSPLCDALIVEVKQDGVTQYEGAFSELITAPSTDFGTWEFRFDLPPTTSVLDGEECEMMARFYAWRTGVTAPEDADFDDEELLLFSFIYSAPVVIYSAPVVMADEPEPLLPVEEEMATSTQLLTEEELDDIDDMPLDEPPEEPAETIVTEVTAEVVTE
jgi:hypothetical protein